MRLLHTADLHYSVRPEKLAETITVSRFILSYAQKDRPDAAVLAGDTFDEYDGPIRLDSETARAAIHFVRALADVCPVLVVRGTPSHDRNAPELLREVRSRHPIHVSTEIEQVGLFDGNWRGLEYPETPCGAFTCIPSLDKARLYALGEATSRAAGNVQARELLSDLFGEIGTINKGLSVPRIAVGHGMITGAAFSTGQTAIGEDFEVGTSDLLRLACDYYAWGHVHRHQCFGPICYAGSPGRMNFGEVEEKGFIVVDVERMAPPRTLFVPTPARLFAFKEAQWDGVARSIEELISEGVSGKHVRFRYSVPEEHAGALDRSAIDRALREAGAVEVKIEATVVPKVRQRAEGISRISGLRDKGARWGEVVGEPLPAAALAILAEIEGKSAEELVTEAIGRIDHVEAAPETNHVAGEIPARHKNGQTTQRNM